MLLKLRGQNQWRLFVNAARYVCRFKKPIFLIAIAALVIIIVNIAAFTQPRKPDIYIVPTPTSNSTSTPTSTPLESTPSPVITPLPTPTPTSLYVPSSGNIHVTGLEVYGGNLSGRSIGWGTLNVGDSENVSFYVRSTSNVPIVLAFDVSDWYPPAMSSYLVLSWDYNGTCLRPNQSILLTLTLTSSSSEDFKNYLINNNVTSFNFDIHIYAA